MKYAAALSILALNMAFISTPAFAECHFGTDTMTGTETIICETDGAVSSWGTLIAEA